MVGMKRDPAEIWTKWWVWKEISSRYIFRRRVAGHYYPYVMLCLRSHGCRANQLKNTAFVLLIEGVCYLTISGHAAYTVFQARFFLENGESTKVN